MEAGHVQPQPGAACLIADDVPAASAPLAQLAQEPHGSGLSEKPSRPEADMPIKLAQLPGNQESVKGHGLQPAEAGHGAGYEGPWPHARQGSGLHDADECRICLQSDFADDLVHPCQCSGTMYKAHLACLTQWALEKRLLECELCKQQYKEPYFSHIKAKLDATPGEGSTQVYGGGQESIQPGGTDAVDTRFISWQNVMCHVLVLLILLAVIIYITVFSSIAPSLAEDWTGVLWRVLIVIIPGYLMLRFGLAIYRRWRDDRQVRAVQEARRVHRLHMARLERWERHQRAMMHRFRTPGPSTSRRFRSPTLPPQTHAQPQSALTVHVASETDSETYTMARGFGESVTPGGVVTRGQGSSRDCTGMPVSGSVESAHNNNPNSQLFLTQPVHLVLDMPTTPVDSR